MLFTTGLAESLQSELMLYDIDVHICFPGTIFSPGYIQENLVKPKVTLKIEERDEGMSPEGVAENLLKGVFVTFRHGMDIIDDTRAL